MATATTTEIENLIRNAYRTVTTQPGAWIRLVDLREAIGDVNRHAVDRALATMADVDVMPESNQKTLRQIDRDLAVWCGGDWNHLVSIR